MNTVLIRQPSINIYGAPIGSIICQIISFTYCFTMLSKSVSLRLNVNKYIIKPLFCSVIMGITAYFSHKAILYITDINIVSVIASIIIAAVVYAVMILLTNSLSKDEMEMLPMGTKLYSVLNKFKLVR